MLRKIWNWLLPRTSAFHDHVFTIIPNNVFWELEASASRLKRMNIERKTELQVAAVLLQHIPSEKLRSDCMSHVAPKRTGCGNRRGDSGVGALITGPLR